MFLRALFAFLALPGIVAFAVPIFWPVTTLVVAGLYRYSRNPMYVSVLLIVLGWAVSFGVHGLYWYTVFVAIAFHLRVLLGEEPWLARTHGAIWDDYVRRVRRWP